MITVLHLITSLGAGGAETMLYKLVAHSDRARFRHLVVSMIADGPLAEEIARCEVPVYTLGMRRGVPNPAAAIRFLLLLRHLRPDVVQTWLYHADLLGTLGALVTRVPVVWNIRSSFHYGLRSPISRACVRLSGVPAAVVVNSEAGRAVHAALGYRPRRWEVIPNGFTLPEAAGGEEARASVRRELGLPHGAPLIGLVARFDPLKDHETFLRAAGLLCREKPDTHFLLAGNGVTSANPTLCEIIAAEGLGARVHLLGERQDVPRLTAALDIATSSSYAESFPTVVGEAMACGIPCAVTDVGDSAHIVGDTGVVVPPRQPEALAAGWRQLLELSPDERRALGWRARARVEQLFALDRVVRQYEELYERVATGPGRCRRSLPPELEDRPGVPIEDEH